MKKAPTKKKETTIDDLAVMMSKGFHDVNKKIDEDINNLAAMVAKGFESADKRFDKIENRLGNVESRLENVEEDLKLKATREDLLNLGDRFVLKYEFHELLVRFDRLEQKVKTKK